MAGFSRKIQFMKNLSDQSPVLIVGTGAMASLFAARLSAAGFQVSMFGHWSAALKVIREKGIRLLELDGSEVCGAVTTLNQSTGRQSFRYALVLVKSWQTREAAHQLQHFLTADGVALTLQNGMGNDEILAEFIGEQRVLLGVTTLGATLVEPGVVRSGGDGVILLEETPSPNDLADILTCAGFQVKRVADTETLLWGKLVINAAINPVTALLNVKNGGVITNRNAYEIMKAAGEEAARVAKAHGISLPYLDPAIAAESVARQTATNQSSMLQDILRGAPTEINAINGAVVTTGERLGIQTPVNWTLWKLVQAMVERETMPGEEKR
jgi:2-dehydropantoate 2-reductase